VAGRGRIRFPALAGAARPNDHPSTHPTGLHHLAFFLAVLVCAVLFALLEVQIEDGAGWASSLPTWRVENRWTRLFFSRRPLTGYHLYVHLFVIAAVHLPYALGFAEPAWRAEARILAFLVFFWLAEDFLWFVLNPAFGIRRFHPEHAWWHAPTWWWIMPRDYWVFLPVGVALYWFGTR
jgi:hypothetical protein